MNCKSIYLTLLVMAWSSLNAQENSCVSFLTSNSSSISNLLAPLQTDQLLKNVDFNSTANPLTLNPTLTPTVYTIEDADILSRLKGLPLEKLKTRDRILKTDFGYAILDVDDLRDWALLSTIIDDVQRAKEFIDNMANTQGLYPKGLTRESVDWLKWTVFANKQAIFKSLNNFNLTSSNDFFEYHSSLYKFKKAEFRRLMRQKAIFLFPFGVDTRDDYNKIASYTAQNVLAILARYFILSKLYIQKLNGDYIRLAEFLDRDSLMLFSRFPKLLPAYPVFMDGHFSIENEYTNIGHDDIYHLSKKNISTVDIGSGIKYDLNFIANAMSSTFFDQGHEIDASFSIFIYDETHSDNVVYDTIKDSEVYRRIFSEENDKMDALVTSKINEFRKITGYNLPYAAVIEVEDSEYAHRDFIINFGDATIPEYILVAFFVFLGSN